MNPETDLLSQLRDIHSAPDSPWWPPAPGWWLLAAVIIVAVFFLMRKLQIHYREQNRRKQLLGFIDQITQVVDPGTAPQEYLSGLNRIFKIVAIRAFPDAACAHMQGREWADFLKEKLFPDGGSEGLDILIDGPYQPFAAFDSTRLEATARQWVQKYG